MLLLAILTLPYGYYTLVRISVTIYAVLVAVTFFNSEKVEGMYLFAAIAILFNPILPIYLTKEIWAIIDIVAAGIIVFIYPISHEQEQRN